MIQTYKLRVIGKMVTAAIGCYSGVALAEDFQIGGATLSVHGTATIGQAWRADGRDPELISGVNSNVIGIRSTAFAPNGRNNDDADLNYGKGDPISTVAKGLLELRLSRNGLGAFVTTNAWYDYTLEHGSVAWGNIPNGYSPGSPLSDRGFASASRFSGIALQDAYVYDSFRVADRPIYVALGNQTIPWGASGSFNGRAPIDAFYASDVEPFDTPGTIPGGLSYVNPVDLNAVRRPGVLPEETLRPFPGVFARANPVPQLEVEGFYQVRFRQTETPPCGTFFSISDIIAEGCDKLPLQTISDRAALPAGAYLQRSDSPSSKNGGFGASVAYQFRPLSTKVGLYFSDYTSRNFAPDFIKSARTTGLPFIAGNADGKNPTYRTEYPDNVRMFGVNVASRVSSISLYGEVTYRPNQPVVLNIPDLLNAIVSPTQPSPLRAVINALPPGGVLQGYDRLKVTQSQVAAVAQLGPVLGAASASVGAEAGIRYVNNLPDPSVRRYGRSDAYGLGPVNGTCLPGAPDKQCSFEGYVSKTSWGYRLRSALVYKNVVADIDLTPSLTFASDVRGWSSDYAFIQGRRYVVASLRASTRRFFADLTATQTWGGDYNFLKDRDFFALSVGARF